MSAGGNCLIVWIPRDKPAGRLAVRLTPSLSTLSSYPSSPKAARSAARRRTIEPTAGVPIGETAIGKLVDLRISAASISPIAFTSGLLASTYMPVVLTIWNGGPADGFMDAGAG